MQKFSVGLSNCSRQLGQLNKEVISKARIRKFNRSIRLKSVHFKELNFCPS